MEPAKWEIVLLLLKMEPCPLGTIMGYLTEICPGQFGHWTFWVGKN
jgi:hypothetical protein